jgi:hypothetical protein
VASDWLGVSYAPGSSLLDPSPTWERLDLGVAGLRVASIGIRDGRQSEFEQTGTGRCTITFRDQRGVLDPTSPHFLGDLISSPLAVALRDPYRDEWFPLWRGCIEEVGFVPVRSRVKFDTVITGVDALDYFANYELIPGLAGFTNAQLNAQGYVFYEDAGFDERIFAVAGDAGWPVELSSFFTGNIVCTPSKYSSGDKVLQVIQEACDAEMPTVANYYVDARGIVQIHGRYARFSPAAVSASASNWIFREWKAGDNAAAGADPGLGGTAKMQPPYEIVLSRSAIRNAALCYPQGTDQSDLSDYISTDEASRTAHGTRTWTAPNLQIQEETTIGLTAKAYCQLLSNYITQNYANPIPRISKMTIGTEHPYEKFGAASWEMISEASISDRVDVTIGHPGGGGFEEEGYFIEGRTIDLLPGPGGSNPHPIVKASYDLTPAAFYDSNPFGAFS